MLTPKDKEWLVTELENATLRGLDKHRLQDHTPLEEKLDATRKMVWVGSGIVGTISAGITAAIAWAKSSHA